MPLRSKKASKMSKTRRGKIVYRPPEKSYTNVNIEETPHGFKIYRDGSARPFAVIPHSAVKQVIYDRGE